jgi:hypothetical protein
MDQLDLPIVVKEFIAVEKALLDNEGLVSVQNILWEVDSQTVQHYWWNQGGINNVPLCHRVLDLLLWCQARGTLVVPKWIKSRGKHVPRPSVERLVHALPLGLSVLSCNGKTFISG